ncbi:hypothetical protein QTP88_017995 [Uroleucon formosanum]
MPMDVQVLELLRNRGIVMDFCDHKFCDWCITERWRYENDEVAELLNRIESFLTLADVRHSTVYSFKINFTKNSRFCRGRVLSSMPISCEVAVDGISKVDTTARLKGGQMG